MALLGLVGCGGAAITGPAGGDDSAAAPSGGVCDGTTIVCMDEANAFSYDATKDEIHINNLPFDLDGTYQKVDGLTVGGQQVYRNANGARTYYALYVQGTNTLTAASVAATDSYVDYGYSGTMFRGTGNVDLPTDAQATYQGSYQGIRIYEGGGAHGFSTGDVQMVIDFEDFDDTGAISTTVGNRVAYDANGAVLGALPSLVVADTQHEGGVIAQTTISEGYGDTATGASGTLAGIFGGTDGDQVAGVLVLEGPDALDADVNVRETGAFVIDQVSLIRP
ncbi:hypothetical protein SAMN05877831_101124 [Rhodobacter maris]|uniref:Transferrin-binding protein B C-lobe/N-lobe beta barrel domain-containing protein n=1 Tax=Rhodobacter maris TaxID=446682 RepID=A0A285RGA5_9RHOB|nr:hypothetical protein SAMN05877831_101124 [Rhodobacter maris]